MNGKFLGHFPPPSSSPALRGGGKRWGSVRADRVEYLAASK
jgi:hypothetical protein